MGRAGTRGGAGDDKAKPKKGVDRWGGRVFGYYQMLHYVVSSFGLACYFLHYLTGRPLAERVFGHGTLELVLLLTRWANEAYFDKCGLGDVFHHLTMVVGYYLVFFVPSCADFGWAVCHMQILHGPMLVWYLGCRRGCYATSETVTRRCVALFPVAWVASVAHRVAVLLAVAHGSRLQGNAVAAAAALCFGLVLSYLDVGWTAYFFSELRLWGLGGEGRGDDGAGSGSGSGSDGRNPNTGGAALVSLAQALYGCALYSACMVLVLTASAPGPGPAATAFK